MGCPAFHIVKCLLQALPWEGPRLAVAQQQQQQVTGTWPASERCMSRRFASWLPPHHLMVVPGQPSAPAAVVVSEAPAAPAGIPALPARRKKQASKPRGGMKARRQAQAQVDEGKWKATSRLLA